MTVEARPEVTVLMPVHGEGLYLSAALQSLNQELQRTRAMGVCAEALIILDRPTRSTMATVMKSAHAAPGFVVEESPAVGLVTALNHGLDVARGKFLARFDSDDVMLPGRLISQWRAMESDSQLVLIGGQVRRWSSGRVRSTSSLPLDHDRILRALRRGRHAVSHSSCMMPTASLREVGGYVYQGPAEDWDLYLRLARTGRLRNLVEPVTLYRYHSDSINGREALKVQLGIQAAILHERSRSPDDALARAPISFSSHPVRVLRAHRRAISQNWYRRAMASETRRGEWAALFLAGLVDPLGAIERSWRDVRAQLNMPRSDGASSPARYAHQYPPGEQWADS